MEGFKERDMSCSSRGDRNFWNPELVLAKNYHLVKLFAFDFSTQFLCLQTKIFFSTKGIPHPLTIAFHLSIFNPHLTEELQDLLHYTEKSKNRRKRSGIRPARSITPPVASTTSVDLGLPQTGARARSFTVQGWAASLGTVSALLCVSFLTRRCNHLLRVNMMRKEKRRRYWKDLFLWLMSASCSLSIHRP